MNAIKKFDWEFNLLVNLATMREARSYALEFQAYETEYQRVYLEKELRQLDAVKSYILQQNSRLSLPRSPPPR